MISRVGLLLASVLNLIAVNTGNVALGMSSMFFVAHFTYLIGAERR